MAQHMSKILVCCSSLNDLDTVASTSHMTVYNPINGRSTCAGRLCISEVSTEQKISVILADRLKRTARRQCNSTRYTVIRAEYAVMLSLKLRHNGGALPRFFPLQLWLRKNADLEVAPGLASSWGFEQPKTTTRGKIRHGPGQSNGNGCISGTRSAGISLAFVAKTAHDWI
ncbi:hypothetical protein VTG60DRAFT_3697 [Thermothelomyces hinnuleus]